MSENPVPAKVKTKHSSGLGRSVSFLLIYTAFLVWQINLAIMGFMAGDLIIGLTMSSIALMLLWNFGSIYITVPLALYFHSKYPSERNYAALDLIHRRSLKLLSKLPLRHNVSVIVTTSNLGLLRLCQGYYESGESLFEEAAKYVARSRRLAKSTSAIVIYNNLSISKIRQNKYFEAEETALKALELAESPALKKRHAIYAAAPQAALAAIALRLNEIDSALTKYLTALETCENNPVPQGVPSRSFEQFKLHIFLGLALCTIKLNRVEESEEWCKRSWVLIESDGSKLYNSLTLENLNLLADEYINKQLYKQAEPLLELAYAIGQETPFHPDARKVLSLYEQLLIQTNRLAELPDMRSCLRPTSIECIG